MKSKAGDEGEQMRIRTAQDRAYRASPHWRSSMARTRACARRAASNSSRRAPKGERLSSCWSGISGAQAGRAQRLDALQHRKHARPERPTSGGSRGAVSRTGRPLRWRAKGVGQGCRAPMQHRFPLVTTPGQHHGVFLLDQLVQERLNPAWSCRFRRPNTKTDSVALRQHACRANRQSKTWRCLEHPDQGKRPAELGDVDQFGTNPLRCVITSRPVGLLAGSRSRRATQSRTRSSGDPRSERIGRGRRLHLFRDEDLVSGADKKAGGRSSPRRAADDPDTVPVAGGQ